jgi:hypothetical protein
VASLSFFSLEHAARSGGGGRTRRRSAPFLSSPRQSDGGRCQCPVRGIQGQDGSHVYGRPYRTAWRCTDALQARCRVSCLLSLSLTLLYKKKQTTRLSRCADTFGRFFVHRHRVQYSRRRVCGIVCFCCKEGWESTWVLGVVCAARSATSSVVSLGLACTSAHASRYSLRKPRGSLGIGWSGVEVGFTGNSAMLCLWFLPCRERTQENDVCQMFPYIIPVIFMFVNYPWSQLPPRAPRGCSSLGVDQHHHHSPAEEQVPSFNMDDGSSSSHHALAISSSEMLVTGEEE